MVIDIISDMHVILVNSKICRLTPSKTGAVLKSTYDPMLPFSNNTLNQIVNMSATQTVELHELSDLSVPIETPATVLTHARPTQTIEQSPPENSPRTFSTATTVGRSRRLAITVCIIATNLVQV